MLLTTNANNDDLSNRRKAEMIAAYVSQELKSDLEQWAEEENRSVSSLITHLLTKAVKEKRSESKENP